MNAAARQINTVRAGKLWKMAGKLWKIWNVRSLL